MSLKTKVFILIPLAVFGALVFGIAIYNTLCKNSLTTFLNC